MAISPIETVTMAPKSQEASFQKIIVEQKPVHEQINLQHRMEHQIQRDAEKTVQLSETNNPEYRYDAREKGKNQRKQEQKKRKNSQQTEDEKPIINQSGATFDIRI